MSHSTDLSAALEAYICDEVARQLAEIHRATPPRLTEHPPFLTVREAAAHARRSED